MGPMYTGTAPAPLREVRYEGVHCDLVLSQLAREVVLLRITGTDVGEFGEAPMKALTEWISETSGLEFFIDAREVRGASIAVSGDWAAWLSAHRQALRSVTMLTGSEIHPGDGGIRAAVLQLARNYADLHRDAGVRCRTGVCAEPAAYLVSIVRPLSMARLVVLRQQIQSEIAFEIAPNRMDVVGFVLRVVILD